MKYLRRLEQSNGVTQPIGESEYPPFFGVFRDPVRHSRAEQVFFLVAVFALTSLLDFLVDPSLSLFALYLIPTLYSAWFLGMGWGYGTCLASAIVWGIDDWVGAIYYHNPLIPLWNLAGRLLVLTVIVVMVNALKKALEAEHESQRRFVQREFEIARDVQMHLLPTEIPKYARLDLGFIYQPAGEVGGDYYDVIPIDSERFGIAVGDVSGKGVPSALLMASLEALVRTHLATGDSEIARSVSHLNASLYKLTTTNRFATLFFGLVNLPTQTLCYVNAGHNPPLLFRNRRAKPGAAGALESLDAGGPPVGLFANTDYQQAQVPLCGDDVLVAYTDGAVEALNSRGEEFGKERLCQVVWEHFSSSATVICERIREQLSTFVGDQAQFDDITLVVLKMKPG